MAVDFLLAAAEAFDLDAASFAADDASLAPADLNCTRFNNIRCCGVACDIASAIAAASFNCGEMAGRGMARCVGGGTNDLPEDAAMVAAAAAAATSLN